MVATSCGAFEDGAPTGLWCACARRRRRFPHRGGGRNCRAADAATAAALWRAAGGSAVCRSEASPRRRGSRQPDRKPSPTPAQPTPSQPTPSPNRPNRNPNQTERLSELAEPYYAFKAGGYDVTIASPRGGAVPLDPASLEGGAATPAARRFLEDGGSVPPRARKMGAGGARS
jgi:hypothetical protein